MLTTLLDRPSPSPPPLDWLTLTDAFEIACMVRCTPPPAADVRRLDPGPHRGGIAEFKTAPQPLAKAIRPYSDQLQWQMHVLHTERVLFVVEDRHTFAREWTWVHRDERRIRVLVEHADRFIAELEERQAQRRAAYAEV